MKVPLGLILLIEVYLKYIDICTKDDSKLISKKKSHRSRKIYM